MSITAAKLQAEVGADTKGFDRGMDHADKRVAGAGSKWGKALKVGLGVGLGLAAVAITRGVIGAMNAGIASLKAEGVVVAQTNAVIKSTGASAHVSAAGIRDLSNAIEDKTAIDDKQVQAGANMLLTFTNIKNAAGASNDIFTQSVGILADVSTAMGTDMKSGAIQMGKALNDPLKGITALTRIGVTFDATQKKQIANFVKAGKTAEAQKIILRELNKEFGGSGAAFAATDEGKAAHFQDAIEGIQQSLARGMLPALTRVQGALDHFLRDPSTMGQAEALGNSIASIFSEGNLKTAASVMTMAAGAIGTAIKLFSGLPPELQALAVGAVALKKITGIGPLDIVKGAGGLIKMVFERGATPANPLFVADVAGAVGGAGGVAGAAAGAAGAGALTTGLALTTAVVAPLAVAAAAKLIQDKIDTQGGALVTQARGFAAKATDADLARSIKGVTEQLNNVALSPFNERGKIVDTLNVLIAEKNRRTVNAGKGKAGTEMYGPPTPAARPYAFPVAPGVLDAIAKRSKAAGFAGNPTAVIATYERTQIRLAAAQKAATERTTAAAARTAAAVGNLAGPMARGQSGVVNLTVLVPAVQSYVQTVIKTIRYGPMVPNATRRNAGAWGGK